MSFLSILPKGPARKPTEKTGAADARLIQFLGYAALALSISTSTVSIFLDRIVFAFVANGVLLAYVIAAFLLARGNASVMSRMGENVYFLGYLLTISGLALLAYEVGMDPSLLDKENITMESFR